MFKNILNLSKLNAKSTKLFSLESTNIKFTKKLFSENNSEKLSKNFEKRINSVKPDEEDEEHYSNIEQYMKVFNERVYKQNSDLTQKLTEIFKENTHKCFFLSFLIL